MNMNAADRNRQQLRQVSGSDIFRRASQLMAANRDALAVRVRQDRIVAKAAELADK
jgi:predicted HTH domain antitoxin